LEFGIFLNSFVEITVLAAPVSAVKVTLIPCILFNRFGSDPDKTKQEVDDSSKVIGDSPLFNRYKSSTSMSVSELNFSNRGLSPITLDESSTSYFVLSGSEPNLPNSKKPRLERSSALASVNGQPLT
jgi:hypothetical protein